MSSLQAITPKAAQSAIRAALGANLPVMLWGPPGVGKSDILRCIAAADYDGNMTDIRLSQYEPAELSGLPVPDHETRTTVYYSDALLPGKNSPPRGVLFLDEVTSAPPPMSAAAYQLVLDRCYRGHRLPDGWRVVAAGNRTRDRGVAYAMPAPLANRFVHLSLDPTDESIADDWRADWLEWAAAASVHPYITAFIRFRPAALYSPPEAGATAFPTPRAWAMLGRHLDYCDHTGTDPDRNIIAGTVGLAEGESLAAFLRHRQDVPSIEEIIANPDGCRVPTPDKLGALFFSSGMVAAHLGKDTAAPLLRYLERIPEEIATGAVLGAPEKARHAITLTPAYQRWLVTYAPYLVA